MNETIDPHAQVSHEQDGRVLSGVGVSADDLSATMDRHAPTETPEAPGAAGGAGTPAAPASTDPPQTRGRQRFSDLTKERDSAKAETTAERTKREELERDVTELRAQLARATTPQQAQQAQQQLVQVQQQQASQRFTFPAYEQFVETNPTASYDDWQDAKLDARDAWRDQQNNIDQRIQQGIAAAQASTSFAQTVQSTRDKGRAVYKDFDTVLASGSGALVPLGLNPQIAIPRATYVIQHPQSEHLQYAIMRDGDLARRLQQMSDIDFGMAIAQIATPTTAAQSRASASPPAPYQPVGSGSATQPVPSSELTRKGFDFDKSGYREKRAAERGLQSKRR